MVMFRTQLSLTEGINDLPVSYPGIKHLKTKKKRHIKIVIIFINCQYLHFSLNILLAFSNCTSVWRLVKKSRKSNNTPSCGIKNEMDVVVNETVDVLKVWKTHFENLGTPKCSDSYDEQHYRLVTERVKLYNVSNSGEDVFHNEPFSCQELVSAISALNCNKAPGYNGITGEHIRFAGHALIDRLLLY